MPINRVVTEANDAHHLLLAREILRYPLNKVAVNRHSPYEVA